MLYHNASKSTSFDYAITEYNGIKQLKLIAKEMISKGPIDGMLAILVPMSKYEIDLYGEDYIMSLGNGDVVVLGPAMFSNHDCGHSSDFRNVSWQMLNGIKIYSIVSAI